MYEIYLVVTEPTKCHKCNKNIKVYYEYNGEKYGWDCYCRMLNINVDSNGKPIKKPLPAWLYDLMNQYIEESKDEINDSYSIDDFNVNFWNSGIFNLTCPKHGTVYSSLVKINGKNISIEKQLQMSEYLNMRYNAILKENAR